MLLVRTRASKTKAGDDPLSGDTQHQMAAFVPAQAIPPADICLTRQPAPAASFRIAGDCGSALEHLAGTSLGLQQLDQPQGKSRDGVMVGALQPIELAAVGQMRKRGAQVMPRIPVKRSFAL
jgi:hypothetical protein